MTSDDYFDEIQRLLRRASELPNGLEELELVEQSLGIAERAGDVDLQFELRLALAQTAFNCGQLEKSIVAIAWCFGMRDRDPDRFGDESLLAGCTYAMNSLSSLPTSSRAQITALIDNIEQRYLEAGYSLRAVYRARCFNALWMGDHDEADRTFAEMKRCQLDLTYEGETWSRLFECDYLMQRGWLEKAFRTARPILESDDDAHGTYCWLASFMLLPLLRLNKADLAAQAQRRSVSDIVDNPSFAECVGHHIVYLVAVGRAEEAVGLVDRCIVWALEAPLLRESFELALGAWACVRSLRTGEKKAWPGVLPASHADMLVPGDLAEMESALEAFTATLAKQFDERNQNSHFADMIRERLAVAEPDWEP